ncbi:hypothetical protein HY732_03155 [Candidatus Uhrbacteria bacterium]|nr:hypothetical protein [Candidatus Uhrbacteria bacterium]
MQPNHQKFTPGFTLLEVLLSVAIMILIAGAAFPLYGNLQWTAQINDSTARIVGDMRLARELSAARLADSQYGIFFEVNPLSGDRMVFFRGSSYATRTPAYDRITTFSDTLIMQTALGGGVSEIIFSKNSARPSSVGTIMLTHSASGALRTISINTYGMVDVQ